MVAASSAAMRTAAMRTAAVWPATAAWPATAVRRPHSEMRGAATMWATPHPTAAMRTAAVKCRTTVERGRASDERRSAMGCGRAMEPRTAAERRPAMKARRAMERRFPAGCSSTSMDRSHRAETPGIAAGGPAPGRAGASRRRHCRSPGCIEAPPRSRIGIGDAATMGGVMHPNAAREGGVAGGRERVTGGDRRQYGDAPNRPTPIPKDATAMGGPKPIQNPGSYANPTGTGKATGGYAG